VPLGAAKGCTTCDLSPRFGSRSGSVWDDARTRPARPLGITPRTPLARPLNGREEGVPGGCSGRLRSHREGRLLPAFAMGLSGLRVVRIRGLGDTGLRSEELASRAPAEPLTASDRARAGAALNAAETPLAVPPKAIRACVCSLPARALRGAPRCVGKSSLDLVRRRACVHAWSALSSAYACPLQAKARIPNPTRPASAAGRIERSACGGFVANGGAHHRQFGWRESACTPGQLTGLGRAPSRERINAAIARLRTVALHVVP
jgi:hypothetical protein